MNKQRYPPVGVHHLCRWHCFTARLPPPTPVSYREPESPIKKRKLQAQHQSPGSPGQPHVISCAPKISRPEQTQLLSKALCVAPRRSGSCGLCNGAWGRMGACTGLARVRGKGWPCGTHSARVLSLSMGAVLGRTSPPESGILNHLLCG